MATLLDKEIKRQVSVGGRDYTVVIDPEGLRLVGKGKRKAEIQLRWTDLLSGEAALAVALNASLAKVDRPAEPSATTTSARAQPGSMPSRATKRAEGKAAP